MSNNIDMTQVFGIDDNTMQDSKKRAQRHLQPLDGRYTVEVMKATFHPEKEATEDSYERPEALHLFCKPVLKNGGYGTHNVNLWFTFYDHEDRTEEENDKRHKSFLQSMSHLFAAMGTSIVSEMKGRRFSAQLMPNENREDRRDSYRATFFKPAPNKG